MEFGMFHEFQRMPGQTEAEAFDRVVRAGGRGGTQPAST